MLKRVILGVISIALLVAVAACGKDGGSSPTAPSPSPTPTPTPTVTYKVTGTISSAAGGGIANATIRVVDGLNAGTSTTTDGGGNYTLTVSNGGGFTIDVAASGYVGTSKGITLTATSPTATANFTLLPAALWSRNGSGDTVFDMPTYISRVRIIGTYTGYTSNFIVWVGNDLLVNELLGTGWGVTRYEGVLLTRGGVVQVKNSSGVSWSFTEVR
jgi:hypothetical protein